MIEVCITEVCITETVTVTECEWAVGSVNVTVPVASDCDWAVGSVIVTTLVENDCPWGVGSVLVTAPDCTCCPNIPAIISGPTSCYKVGDVIVYSLTGCDCADLDCGKVGYSQLSSNFPPACIVQNDPAWGGQNTLTLGPLKNTELFKFGVACVPDEVCP